MLHKGKSGKEYANPQVMAHEEGRMAPKKEAGEMPPKEDGADDSDIPSHLEAMHSKIGGKHMHVHQGDDGKMTSHQHSDMGPEGPHEHAGMDALHEHQRGFMDEGGMPEMGAKPMMGMNRGGY